MGAQLNLFKGKRQRGEAPPPALEFQVCCAISDTIDVAIRPGWRYTHLPFGEHRDHAINPKTGKRYSPTGSRLKRMGTKKGWPDYIFVGPARAMFWLEMKRGKRGRPSEEQEEIAAHLLGCGFDYLRASSYKQAIDALVERRIIWPVEVQ
jgi:hypothetical protein